METMKQRPKTVGHSKSTNGTREIRHPSKEEQIEQMRNFFNPETFPKEFGNWSDEEQDAFIGEKLSNYKQLPIFVLKTYPGFVRYTRSEDLPADIPEWADAEKLRRGQQFARKNFLQLSLNVIMGHFMIYTFREMRQPIDMTRNSFTPYKAFIRFLNTMRAVRKMVESDLLKKGSPAYDATRYSRKVHGIINQRCDRQTVAELNELSRIKKPWSPTLDLILKDIREAIPELEVDYRSFAYDYDAPWRQRGISQTAMSFSFFTFTSILIANPTCVGVHDATEQERDDFCHWARLSIYLLGVDDKYNLFNGTLSEIQEKIRLSMELFTKPNLREIDATWEHMMRCMATAASYYVPFISFETYLLLSMDYMDIPMKNFRASMGFIEHARYKIVRFLIGHLMKWPLVSRIVNKIFDYLMNRTMSFGPKKLAELEEHSNKTLLAASAIL